MIFFGTRGRTAAGQQLTGPQCPNCQNNTFTSFGVQRYFHLLLDSHFPDEKTRRDRTCSNCKQVDARRRDPDAYARRDREKAYSRPAGHCPCTKGALIIAAFIGFDVFGTEQDRVQEAAYVEQPAVDDYYIVDYTKMFEDAEPGLQLRRDARYCRGGKRDRLPTEQLFLQYSEWRTRGYPGR